MRKRSLLSRCPTYLTSRYRTETTVAWKLHVSSQVSFNIIFKLISKHYALPMPINCGTEQFPLDIIKKWWTQCDGSNAPAGNLQMSVHTSPSGSIKGRNFLTSWATSPSHVLCFTEWVSELTSYLVSWLGPIVQSVWTYDKIKTNHTRNPHLVYEYTPAGRRNKGRPKKRCTDQHAEDVTSLE
jgi:hypothetical protein